MQATSWEADAGPPDCRKREWGIIDLSAGGLMTVPEEYSLLTELVLLDSRNVLSGT